MPSSPHAAGPIKDPGGSRLSDRQHHPKVFKNSHTRYQPEVDRRNSGSNAYRIDQFVTLDDRVIIMFEFPDEMEDDPESGRNIFAYDETGKELWRIEDSGIVGPGSEDETEVPWPYTGIGQEEDGRIIVGHPAGYDFDLDPETGKVSNAVFTK